MVITEYYSLVQSKNFNININLNVEKIHRINVEINEICEINSVSQSFFLLLDVYSEPSLTSNVECFVGKVNDWIPSIVF